LTSQTVTEGVFAKRTAKEKRRLNLTGQIEGQRVVNDFIACGETDRIMSGTFPPRYSSEWELTTRMPYTFLDSVLYGDAFEKDM